MRKDDRIFVAGHRGLVGSAIVRRLEADGFENLILRSSDDVDLRDAAQVETLFAAERPAFVFVAAAKVGGIMANSRYPADFIRDNLAIELNVMEAAHRHDVAKLLFLGSSCIYPKCAPQPIREQDLLTGRLEPTNEPYAIAKIAGIKLCQSYNRQYDTDFISAMPTNVYGPGDNFDLETSHVLPALIRKFHEARVRGEDRVTVWGSGTPRREFLYVDDLAEACLFLMRNYSGSEIVNVGVGRDISIAELASLIREIVGFEGQIHWDRSKPDGTPRKLLDVSRMAGLGWEAETSLRAGITATYAWYRDHPAVDQADHG